ncbi:MAG: membrane dipeptidase [Planctomycetales bacterium]|nr:membrane dipeptidase [Planctomycetales bacterium]
MHIFDAHLDIALNGVDWNRDLRQTVDDIRSQEIQLGMNEHGRQTNTLSLPELRRAQVSTCLATLLARQEKEINHSFGWITPQACYAMAHAHLAYYRAMEREGSMRMLRTQTELETHRQQYAADPTSCPLGFILAMEGADPLLTPDTVEEFHAHGLRAIGLTHYGANRYGGGTRCEVGLSLNALPLMEKISQLGMTLDVTHLSDVSFWQVLEHFSGRIHASHQNSRRLASWQRQFSDEQYLAVIERDGVIGIAFDIIMLQEGYVRGHSPHEATIATAVENIDIVCQLAGNAKHVGIGSDLDGGYGYDQTPSDLNRYSDLQCLPALLEKRGYPAEDIAGILHGNWFRFFGEALPSN